MKIQPINYNYNTFTNVNNSKRRNVNATPSFQGFIPRFRTRSYEEFLRKVSLKNRYTYIAEKIGTTTDYIASLMHKNKSCKRVEFLNDIANLYKHSSQNKSKDDLKTITSIFKSVKKPISEHSEIIFGYNGTLEQLEQIFKLAKSKKDLQFVNHFQHDLIPSSKQSADAIIQLLKSPNKKSYVNNTDKYETYFLLNYKNPDMVKELEKEVSSGTFNPQIYDAEYAMKGFTKNEQVNKYISGHIPEFEKAYSKEGEVFLKKLCPILSDKGYNNQGIEQDVLDMYKTVTSENLDTRLSILKKFKYQKPKTESSSENKRFADLKSLFKAIDSDKEVKKFVDKASDNDLNVNFDELIQIINTVPMKKANIFYDNLNWIVSTTSGEERIHALTKELENPFYESENYKVTRKPAIEYGYVKPESELSRFDKYIRNKFNKIKYTLSSDKKITILTDSPKTEQISATKPVEIAKPEVVEHKPSEELNLKNNFKTSPQARKLLVIQDVNNIIQKKLGRKTLERQTELYSQKATKIRLKLLPEIFNSIKETRKLKKSSVDNRDAVRLYTRIKGNNRKLVRYMLLKENSDGTRMFNVRDIIHYIDKANGVIEKNKKLDKTYRAADAKAYYDKLFNNLVEEYGKLKIRRKKNNIQLNK